MDHSVRFDLEQGIMNAWSVVEDLKLAAEFANEPKIVELLNSMACLYHGGNSQTKFKSWSILYWALSKL